MESCRKTFFKLRPIKWLPDSLSAVIQSHESWRSQIDLKSIIYCRKALVWDLRGDGFGFKHNINKSLSFHFVRSGTWRLGWRCASYVGPFHVSCFPNPFTLSNGPQSRWGVRKVLQDLRMMNLCLTFRWRGEHTMAGFLSLNSCRLRDQNTNWSPVSVKWDF